ncbi:N-acyl homoserine lactonase family protein [Dactylosporangium sp. CA-092794]|uniref:N-acyl homoserine lactonase family protein n=1 Tax=Dactylosporangium sp. CA-092794 TaxID=3239929 RepID=UPI003D8FDA93
MNNGAIYDVYALRQATSSRLPLSRWYHRYDVYGEPDGPCPMDFSFWVARGAGRTVLVDCGLGAEVARRKGIDGAIDAAELLARVGVDPASVDHVVLSHLHFDHVGNVDLFPNATFTLARRELAFWTGPAGDLPALSTPVVAEEVRAVLGLRRDGRLRLVEDAETLFDGIRVTRVGGHTPGQLVTEVDTRAGRIVLASDAVHFYDELRRNRLFAGCSCVEEQLDTYDRLRRAADEPGTTVVPGHDPAVASGFELVAPDCVDLTRPRSGAADRRA